MGKRSMISAGLDIGTTRVSVIVADVSEERIDVIGFGRKGCNTLRNGVIIDMEKTASAIREAVNEAEKMAGCEINTVFAGVGGNHIQSFNGEGIARVSGSIVTEADMKRAIEQARLVSIPPDREIIHIIPQEYLVDDQDGIMDPRGLSGSNIKVKVHIVTGLRNRIGDLSRCISKAGLNISALILQPLSSSESVLTDDEKILGVICIDVGGGTTDLTIYKNGSIIHSSIITMGGEDITHDIASGLSTSRGGAEMIKTQYGCAMPSMVPREEMLEVPDIAGGRARRKVSRRLLSEIIKPKVEELFEFVSQDAGRVLQGRCSLPGGIVITGGCANLGGVVEFAEEFLGVRARAGLPQGVEGYGEVIGNPVWATGVGLLLSGKSALDTSFRKGFYNGGLGSGKNGLFRSLFSKIRFFLNWLVV